MKHIWNKKWTKLGIHKNGILFYMKLIKSKCMDINLSTNYYNIFNLECHLSHNCDHAGFLFAIGIWKYGFQFEIYDSRHWNWKEGRYYKEDEEVKYYE